MIDFYVKALYYKEVVIPMIGCIFVIVFYIGKAIWEKIKEELTL